MARNFLGLLAGLLSSFFVIMLVEMIGHAFYPPPEGIDYADLDTVKEYLPEIPIGALLFVILAYFIGSMAGGFVLGIIGGKNLGVWATVLGKLLLLAGLINLIRLPGHPIWFWIISLLVYIPSVFLGLRLSKSLPNNTEGPMPN